MFGGGSNPGPPNGGPPFSSAAAFVPGPHTPSEPLCDPSTAKQCAVKTYRRSPFGGPLFNFREDEGWLPVGP